jgi:hypothetical protein
MQIKKLFPPLTEQWKTVYEKERPNLTPNAISGAELAAYVQTRFGAEPITDAVYLDAIRTDVQNDAFFREKLRGAEPEPAAFRLGDGTFVGIDLVSGWFIAESDTVRIELTYAKGLDEADLENVIRTVDWLNCKKRMEALPRKGRPLPNKPAGGRRRPRETRDERN